MNVRAGPPAATVAALLQDSALPPLEARILLGHALGWTRSQLITRDRDALPADAVAAFRQLEARRLSGEPIAYLTGQREFYGLSLIVTPDVLIPRPETELLVELALERCRELRTDAPRVLDLGTGSGAIALAIAHACPSAQVTAIDRSGAALAVARANAQRLGLALTLLESDWYGALTGQPAFDVIVANPPYIRAGDPHLSAGDLPHEPAQALTDGRDGLSALRTIVNEAPGHLAEAGWLLCEHGYDQAEAVRDLLRQAGFGEVFSARDLAGIERVSGARLVPARTTEIR